MQSPTVCFQCGTTIANKIKQFMELLAEKNGAPKGMQYEVKYYFQTDDKYKDNNDICEKLGIVNDCCKSHIISAIDLSMYRL
jgi:DNA-directed RNA polymerase subunit N (RpoN/RPB10)